MAENEASLRISVGKAREKGEGKDGEDAPDLSAAPIFAELEGESRELLDHVIVERLGPVREGELGRFEPDVTSQEIFERHGGGKYRVQGRTKGSRPIKGAFVTKELSGEPILRSRIAKRQYAQMIGGDDSPAAVGGGASLPEIMHMLETTRTSADAERERRAEQEEARHKREIERLAAEAKIRADERAAEDERRRRADEEREQRRKRDDDERRAQDKRDADERDDRRRRDEESSRQRDREFQATMLAATRSATPPSDPVAMLLAGVNLMQKIGGNAGGEGPGDPLTALAANLPATVTELGKMFKGGGAANPDDLTITGALGQKGNRVVQHLQQQGINVEAALDHAFNMLLTARGPGPQPAQTAQAAPARGPGGRPVVRPAASSPAPATKIAQPTPGNGLPADPPPAPPAPSPG